MRVVLASSSPRRQQLLTSLDIPFDIIKPDVDETRRDHEPPLAYVERISASKAEAVVQMLAVQSNEPALVIAADTIVVAVDETAAAHGDILGKPANANEARTMLRRLRGRHHLGYTTVQVRVAGGALRAGKPVSASERVCTTVYMREYTDDEIEAYIATGDPFDKAGSYAIQHTGFHPVERIEGCYNNVVGLPLCAVKRLLYTVGFTDAEVPQGCDCSIIT